MIYTNTKLLWPKTYYDPEYVIPKTADLRGVDFDPANQCILLYDQTEWKLLWVQKNSGNVQLSAQCPLQGPYISTVAPANIQVVDITVIKETLYILVYLGDGVLALYMGSLQEGRDTQFINTMEYLLPAYRDPYVTSSTVGISTTQKAWDATHDGSMRYLKYHPKYCSVLHKGTDLYLILAMSINVTGRAPTEMGQWLVAYDPAGFFFRYYQLDDTPSITDGRPLLTDPKLLNGLSVMGCYHDGIISIIEEGYHINEPLTGANKILKPKEEAGLGIGSFDVEHAPFFTGPFRVGDSMCIAGRYAFFLVNNRVFQSDIFMIETYCNRGGDIFSTSIDLGVLASGQTIRRKVYIVNKSPYYTYSNLIIESRDPKVSLSLVDSNVDGPDEMFTDRIKIPGDLPVGAEASFYVQLTAPIFDEDNIVKNFYDQLSYKFESSW